MQMEIILNKALEKDRELRCQSAAEIRADLKRLKRDTDSSRAGVQRLLPRQWLTSGAVEVPKREHSGRSPSVCLCCSAFGFLLLLQLG